MRSNLADIEVRVHRRTEKAVLVSNDGDSKNAVWIPKSQCEIAHTRGDVFTLTAEQSLLEEKELV